jgi:prepilin signal peptidase PulO-like enzyme (type II secretory pathway)
MTVRFCFLWYDTCMIVLLLVVFGLIFGSFINALVWRLHAGRNWVSERSECLQCHHQLAAIDLVPVFSWLYLRGKCRYCKKSIPDSPIVELALPLLFVSSYLLWSAPFTGRGLFDFVFWLIFLVGFLALAVYDSKWFLLPDVIVFPLISLAVLQLAGDWLLFDQSWQTLTGPGIGALIISGTFFGLHYFSKGRWIGFGDVKLGIILGLLAGGALKGLAVLLAASLIGTLVALPMVVQGKANRKSHLPFGPLLIAGIIIVQFFGTSLIDWYINLLSV